jgi:hypothetical protein
LAVVVSAAVQLFAETTRIPLPHDGKFEAPARRCVRVVAKPGTQVRVNGLTTGETSTASPELDITPYLRSGASNTIEAGSSAVLLISPLVYLQTATSDARTLKVAIVNKTENTVQVELGEAHQFTVSPGTTIDKAFPITKAIQRLKMRATSDGLDLIYEDEIAVTITRNPASP